MAMRRTADLTPEMAGDGVRLMETKWSNIAFQAAFWSGGRSRSAGIPNRNAGK
jgi:hypothetical protein